MNVHAKSCLIPETSADTPARNQGPGGSLPGPDAGHPLYGAGGHGVPTVVRTAASVPAACPIGQHNGVIHGHSRVHGHTARPAFELTDTPGPEAFQAGHAGSIPVARSANS